MVDNSNLVQKTLLFSPSVGVWQIDDELYFDRKFHEGMMAYCACWPGPFRLVIRRVNTVPPQFGLVPFNAPMFPAQVEILQPDQLIDFDHLNGVDIVLASGDSVQDLHLADMCRQQGIKCIYGIEYTLETRLQIAAISAVNPWRKLKTMIWLILKERKRLQAFRKSDALQANGVPAYEAYASLVPSTLLYFDTRNNAAMGITDNELAARLAYLDQNAPLRLGFSGRLIKMKGADHLVEIAYQLKALHVPFSFDIFGSGDLLPLMQEKIDRYQLNNTVRLRGAVNYSTELVPLMKANVDLFICCHRQSDPSCTYLETYACGVPIIGYNNKAHQGILARHDVGWAIKMNDIKGCVDLIAHLTKDRHEIKDKAIRAVHFARENTSEIMFESRISHCVQTVNKLN